MINGKRNRELGHRAERHYAQVFRELGFDKCVTSRHGSKLYDDSKIDLIFIPYNVQIKAGKQSALNPAKELNMMEMAIKKNFPPEELVHNKIKILIHKMPLKKGKQTEEQLNEIVYMSKTEYEKLSPVTLLKEKIFKKFEGTEQHTIVSMTFQEFIKIVKNEFTHNI